MSSFGISKAAQSVKLAAQTPGIVEEMKVEVGDKVTKNQELAKINSSLLQIDLSQKKYSLEQAKELYEKKKAIFETSLQKKLPKTSEDEINKLLNDFKWNKKPVFDKNSTHFQTIFQNYQQSKVDLELARSNYFKDRAIYNAKIDINQSQESVTQASLNRKLAFESSERSRKLLDRSIISQTDFDTVENRYKLAASSEKLAKLNYDQLLKTRNSKLLISRKNWENSISRNELAKINLVGALVNFNTELQEFYFRYQKNLQDYKRAEYYYNRSILKAPFDGIIQNRNYDKNESVSGNSAVLELINVEKIIVTININERNISYFKKGLGAVISFDALPNKKFQGIINQVGVSNIATDRNYEVEITVDNPESVIRSGMSAKVEYITQQFKNRLFIPLYSVIEKSDKRVVFIERNNIAEEVEVTTGEIIGDDVLVLSGLKVGDKIIVKGQQFLNPGIAVNIVK